MTNNLFLFRMEQRRKAMLEMPKLIRAWKSVSTISLLVYIPADLANSLGKTTGREEKLDKVPEINNATPKLLYFILASLYIRRVFLCTTMRNEILDSLCLPFTAAYLP